MGTKTLTLRGARLDIFSPDARYRRFSELAVSCDNESFGAATVKHTPATPTCSASRNWVIDGKYADPMLRIVRVAPTSGNFGPTQASTGKRFSFSKDGELGLVGQLIGGLVLASEDPEVAEIIRTANESDAEWVKASSDDLKSEDARTEAIACAAASEGLPAIPNETECLECGAVYASAGHVEAGGMGCDRCK